MKCETQQSALVAEQSVLLDLADQAGTPGFVVSINAFLKRGHRIPHTLQETAARLAVDWMRWSIDDTFRIDDSTMLLLLSLSNHCTMLLLL